MWASSNPRSEFETLFVPFSPLDPFDQPLAANADLPSQLEGRKLLDDLPELLGGKAEEFGNLVERHDLPRRRLASSLSQ